LLWQNKMIGQMTDGINSDSRLLTVDCRLDKFQIFLARQ